MIVQLLVQSACDRQYVSGRPRAAGRLLPEATYSQALDALVLACVDFIPLHRGRLMLSRRTRTPHRDWWINGGRMRTGELYAEAAERLARQELGLMLDPERFHLLGYYSLIWDERAQLPHENGCHTLSITHTIELTTHEIASIDLNDEYDTATWVDPADVLDSVHEYHPALVQMVRDLIDR